MVSFEINVVFEFNGVCDINVSWKSMLNKQNHNLEIDLKENRHHLTDTHLSLRYTKAHLIIFVKTSFKQFSSLK